MKRLVILSSIAALAAAPLAAHPHKDVDQQVALTVAPDHVDLAITIVPSYVSGADIFDMIDRDQDGTVSDTEASHFANDVLQTAILTDGSTVQVWDQITASVPDRDTMAAGSSQIIIAASTDAQLTKATPVQFAIGYTEISHDWFVQPWLNPADFPTDQQPSIDRISDTEISVTLAGL